MQVNGRLNLMNFASKIYLNHRIVVLEVAIELRTMNDSNYDQAVYRGRSKKVGKLV